MAWFIILGALAAWGLLSLVWAAAGWFLPEDRNSVLLHLCRPGTHADGAITRYRWLRGLGLVKGPLLVLYSDASPREREILARKVPGVEFCSLEELPARLEVERNRLD